MGNQQLNTGQEQVWVVSPPRLARFAINHPDMEAAPTTAREYRISSIGRYLVSPAALNVRRRLTGCEIHWRVSRTSRWLSPFRRLAGKKNARSRPPSTLIMDFPNPVASPFDASLKRHIDHLYDTLRPFDSFFQALEGIDPDRAERITGISEDDTGSRAPVALDGTPRQQLEFIHLHAGLEIEVRLKRAHIGDGLFEMKAFDFIKFDPRITHRLIRFVQDGRPRACVLNEDHTIDFWLDDVKLVNYLQLFEYCIQHNPLLRESLLRCIHGEASALRLMFNPRLAIDYSRAPLPAVFQEVFGRTRLTEPHDRLIKQNLNQFQVSVSFNAMNLQESGRSELSTHISILQYLRALEPIRERLPNLFEELDKRAAHSEEGKFYLLESICGARHDG
jgi:hypothetical protein